jgi:hypothetical protein
LSQPGAAPADLFGVHPTERDPQLVLAHARRVGDASLVEALTRVPARRAQSACGPPPSLAATTVQRLLAWIDAHERD